MCVGGGGEGGGLPALAKRIPLPPAIPQVPATRGSVLAVFPKQSVAVPLVVIMHLSNDGTPINSELL